MVSRDQINKKEVGAGCANYLVGEGDRVLGAGRLVGTARLRFAREEAPNLSRWKRRGLSN